MHNISRVKRWAYQICTHCLNPELIVGGRHAPSFIYQREKYSESDDETDGDEDEDGENEDDDENEGLDVTLKADFQIHYSKGEAHQGETVENFIKSEFDPDEEAACCNEVSIAESQSNNVKVGKPDTENVSLPSIFIDPLTNPFAENYVHAIKEIVDNVIGTYAFDFESLLI